MEVDANLSLEDFQSSQLYRDVYIRSNEFYLKGYQSASNELNSKIDEKNQTIENNKKAYEEEINRKDETIRGLNIEINKSETKINNLNEKMKAREATIDEKNKEIDSLIAERDKKDKLIKLINSIFDDTKLGELAIDHLKSTYQHKLNEIIDSHKDDAHSDSNELSIVENDKTSIEVHSDSNELSNFISEDTNLDEKMHMINYCRRNGNDLSKLQYKKIREIFSDNPEITESYQENPDQTELRRMKKVVAEIQM